MKFSIIVPTYNSAQYVKETLLSIAAQDGREFECIIVDDGSSDDTVSIVREFIKDDDRFSLLTSKKNQGPSASRNQGMLKATGEYLLFVDSDDVVDESLLSVLTENINAYPAVDILHWDYGTIRKNVKTEHGSWVPSENWPEGIFTVDDIDEQGGFSRINHELWSKCFKTSFVRKCQLTFNESVRRAEDMLFFVEAFIKSDTNIHIDRDLVFYRKDNMNSLMNNYNSIDEIHALRMLYDAFFQQGEYVRYHRSFIALSASVLNYFAQKSYSSDIFPEIHKEIKSYIQEFNLLDFKITRKYQHVERAFQELAYLAKVPVDKYQSDKRNGVEYGLFAYEFPGYELQHGHNVGDDIQSIAASRFLPRVDYIINRDNIDESVRNASGDNIKLIMNGWYMLGVDNWPPRNNKIKPLLVSMHVNPTPWQTPTAYEAFSTEESVAYLKEFGPVGARDKKTEEIFAALGVDSYFSGCLTLTLNRDAAIQKQDYIIAANVSDEVVRIIESKTDKPVIQIDTLRTRHLSFEEKGLIAQYYLYLYQSASMVVSTRLHATLPSLALQTPVLYVVDGTTNDRPDFNERFRGLYDLVHHTTTAELESGAYDYNFNKPPENPAAYLDIRQKLEVTCSDYTGYAGAESFLDGRSPDDLLGDPKLIGALCKSMNRSLVADDIDLIYADLSEARSHSKALEERIHELESSLSWKVTAPMREVRGLFKNEQN